MTRRRTSLAVLLTSTAALIGLLGTASPAAAEPADTTTTAGTSSTAPAQGSTSTTPDSGTSTSSTSSAASTTSSGPQSSAAPRKAATPGPACTTNADALTPVVCLPEGYGEDETGQVVLGSGIEFDAQIVNNGPAVANANLVITVPAQLRLDPEEPVLRYNEWYDDNSDEDGTPLACTSSTDGATVTCKTGPLASGANALAAIELVATSAAKAGTTATFTTALQPETEGAFPSTSVQATVAFLLPSELALTVTPAKTDVVIGRSKNLTVTVRNVGAGAAPDTFAVSLLLPAGAENGDGDFTSHFSITNAPKITGPDPVALAGSRKAVGPTSVFAARTGRFAAAAAKPTQIAVWPVGTVAPGATASFVITVKALTKGTDSLAVAALTPTQADSSCEGGSDASADSSTCPGTAKASLTAIAAPVTTSASPTTDANAVANTGVNDLTPQLLLGALALLVGIGLTVAGRTRRHGRHSAL